MESLRNKSILIGKEAGQGRLEIVVIGSSKPLIGFIGNPGTVPNTVSRCKPAENMAHAKLDIDSNGNMTLSNMKPQNITYVNGGEIESKRISHDAAIALGAEQYAVNLTTILNSAKQLVKLVQHSQPNAATPQPTTPEKPKKVYNIKHLEAVWNRYHDEMKEIQKRQGEKGFMARLPMLFTMICGTLTAISIGSDWANAIKIICGIFTGIALILMIYSLVNAKSDTSIEDKERLIEEFQEHYCCPNPECNKFLGNQSYKMLKKQTSMRCPHCKSEFIEK